MENTPRKLLDGVRGIIFDYGGTIDSRGTHWSEIIYDGYLAAHADVSKPAFRDAYVHAERYLATHPVVQPTFTFRALMLAKIREELAFLVAGGHLDSAAAEQLAPAIADYCYGAARNAIEDARPTLAALAARYPMVLVSNFYGNIDYVIADFGLSRYFRTVIESAVVGVRKPNPAIFELGVKALAEFVGEPPLKPAEVLVVGDSLTKDILPAESIGCRTAWLKGKGWTDADDAVVRPDIIPSLAALLP